MPTGPQRKFERKSSEVISQRMVGALNQLSSQVSELKKELVTVRRKLDEAEKRLAERNREVKT